MNLPELYDEWTLSKHANYHLVEMVVVPHGSRCLLDLMTHCRDTFGTLVVLLKYRLETNPRANPKTVDFPVMLGSQMARAMDRALHRDEESLELDGDEDPPCLSRLADLTGTFVINGVVKYLPTHLYLRNRSIHTRKNGDSVFFHYGNDHRKKKRVRGAHQPNQKKTGRGQNDTDDNQRKSCMMVRGPNNVFFLNKVEVPASEIVDTLLKSPKLTLGQHYKTDYPEGFTDLMTWLTEPTNYDDLRNKFFFCAGHILYLLKEYALNSAKGNANIEFQKRLASGNLKFLLSSTAKFLTNIARESEETVGYESMHNVFKELSLLNPIHSRTIAQQVVKLTSGYSCSDRKRRLIDPSEYGFICPLGSVDNNRVGLLLDFAQGCSLSGPTFLVPWDRLVSLIGGVVTQIGFQPAVTDRYFYVFVNDVPVERIPSDCLERDITALYLCLVPRLKQLVPQVEVRHDGYVSLFINIYPGLVFREQVTPAEFQDFLKLEKTFPSLENACVNLLPFHHSNPAAKTIFVLHSIRCMIQAKRDDIDLINYNEYMYLEKPESNEAGIDGFYLDTIYLPYKELTAEDALIIKQSASERFKTVHFDQVRLVAQVASMPQIFVSEGDFVTMDKLLLRLPHESKVKLTRKCYTVPNPTSRQTLVLSTRAGVVAEKRWRFQNHEFIFVLVIKHERALQIGSKLITPHGSKSVVSAIVPDEDMPKTVSGRSPDIISSCESFATRFTLGQIKESLQLGGHDTYLEGYQHPVFWGKVFYVLLNHFAADKIFTYKNKMSLSRLTQQPLKGKAKFGGLKLSLSELCALEAFGMSETIYHKFIAESDGQTMFLCHRDGCLHCPEGIVNIKGHHGTHAGHFKQQSFSVKRMCEDYAICGFDISIKSRKHHD